MLRKFATAASLLMIISMIFGAAVQPVQAQEPLPVFHIAPDSGYACGAFWTIGAPVVFSIRDNGGTIIHQETKDAVPAWWDETGEAGEVCFDFDPDLAQPGYTASFSEGTLTKDVLLVGLSFDSINLDGLAVGTGPPGGYGHVCLDHESGCIEITIPTSGEWSVLFDWYTPDMELYEAHVVIWDVDGDEVMANLPVEGPPPQPVINANIAMDEVTVIDLGPDELTFILEVYPPDDSTAKCWGEFSYIPGEEDPWLDCRDVGIEPGDHVYLLVDGEIIRDHVVLDLTINVTDLENGIVSGEAPGGLSGWMYVCNPDENCFGFDFEVDLDGTWEVDVGSGVIDPDAWFNVNVAEEDGDWTTTEIIHPPEPPNIVVGGSWVAAYGFGPDDGVARVEVSRVGAENPLCSGEVVLDGAYDIWLECWNQCEEFLPGDSVELFLDDVLIKVHEVQYLTFDQADFEARTFGGSADFGTNIEVVLCSDADGCISNWDNTGGDTTWTVTFTEIPFYVDWFAAFVYDEDGDATQADFNLPPEPAFTVHPDHGWIASAGWPVDEWVDLVITDPVEGVIYQASLQAMEDEWNPGEGGVWFDLEFMVDQLLPGINVSLSGGGTTKSTVIVPLSFDVIDTDGNASGTGPVGGTGHVCLDHESGCIEITVPPSGDWFVNFPWYDPEMELYEAHVVIWDEDWDETMANLPVNEPLQVSIWAYPQFELVDGNGFPMGEVVTLVIDDDLDPDNGNLYSADAISGPAPWNPEEPFVSFDLRPFDLQAGHYVIMFCLDAFQMHEVINHNITAVNLAADEVSGLADAGSEVMVWIDWSEMVLTEADGSGYWTADFSSVWDLQYGDPIIAGIFDQAGNPTLVYWIYSPLTADDAYEVEEDHVLVVPAPGVLENDIHAMPVPLVAELVSGTDHGLIELNTDGSFSYTPDPDFSGEDSFTYLAKDDRVQSDPALVSLLVKAVNDLPEVDLGPDVFIDEGEIFTGSGSFSDPDQDTWSGTVDYGGGAQDLILNADKTFALEHVYPPDDGIYTLTVTVSDGNDQGSDSLVVTIQNVSPAVEIISLAGGKETVLTGLEVELVVSFSDPGADIHSALIDWGDGSESIDPDLSPFTLSHVYQIAGNYSISVIVTDDDGGTGSASASLTVIDPAEAAQSAIEDLEAILADPGLDPEIADALEDAIVELEGANDGASSSGAIDKIDGGQWNAALVKIAKAIQDLEDAESTDPALDFSATKETLALTAKSVALDVIVLAEAVASTPEDLAAIQQAYNLVDQGQALLGAGDFLGAVNKFQEAMQVL